MDYEKNVCPYDVGQLLTAKEVFSWAVEQEERVHNNIHNQTILDLIEKRTITMDYEKKYKEALERARKWYNDSHITIGLKGNLKDIFPELAEPDDERIRKILIEFFGKGAENNGSTNGISDKDILAWLEKQVPAYLSHDDEILIKQLTEYFTTGKGLQNTNDTIVEWLADVKRKLEKQGDYKRLVEEIKDRKELLSKEKEKATSVNDKLSLGGRIAILEELLAFTKEKQGEQKPAEEYNITGIGSKHAQGKLGEMIKNLKPINEVLEQNPTDNVEPKFHEGDWIVQENIGTYKVIEVCESWYEVIDNQDNRYSIGFDKEYMCHLWTIQDAKDGDVLVTVDDEYPFIYKGCLDPNHPDSPVAYCGIDDGGDFWSGSNKFNQWWTDKKVQRATKEQCDTLFKAMADAGYTFDFDKKELKKIKSKPTAWSEEDEKMSEHALNMIEWYSGKNGDRSRLVSDWLKSLKGRIGE